MGAMVQVKIIKRDINTRKLKRIAQNLNHSYLKSGINKEEGSRVINKSGFTQLQNAVLQEFGGKQTVKNTRRFKNRFGEWFVIKAGTVLITPARLFIRIFTTSHQHRNYLQFELRTMVNNLFRQKLDVLSFWQKLGVYVRDSMRERITNRGVNPQNSKMTVEYKGYNKPLDAGGLLVDDIEYKVVKK